MEALQLLGELVSYLWTQVLVDPLHEVRNQVLHEKEAVLLLVFFVIELDVVVESGHAYLATDELSLK